MRNDSLFLLITEIILSMVHNMLLIQLNNGYFQSIIRLFNLCSSPTTSLKAYVPCKINTYCIISLLKMQKISSDPIIVDPIIPLSWLTSVLTSAIFGQVYLNSNTLTARKLFFFSISSSLSQRTRECADSLGSLEWIATVVNSQSLLPESFRYNQWH